MTPRGVAIKLLIEETPCPVDELPEAVKNARMRTMIEGQVPVGLSVDRRPDPDLRSIDSRGRRMQLTNLGVNLLQGQAL